MNAYLAGPDLSLADLYLAPVISHFQMTPEAGNIAAAACRPSILVADYVCPARPCSGLSPASADRLTHADCVLAKLFVVGRLAQRPRWAWEVLMGKLLNCAVAALAAASVPASAIGQEMMTAIGQGEGQVSIVAWPGYIERGQTDPNYDWVIEFETKTGCKVNIKTAATSDEMVALMNEGGFDLVTASGDASLRLIAGKTVQPINTDLIPSWAKVDDRLKDAPWHTVGGVHYGVPYQWGSNVLAYNTEVFKEAPKSWNVVFEEQTLPDGKSNKGRVQAFDGPIYIADAALYLMHHKPELGMKDPYELTEDQYKAALELLRGQRQIVGRYWHDAMVQVDDFTNEGVVASSTWPFQVNLLKSQKKPIESTVPQEGATGWADTTMLHAAAPNPNCAYMWLEHSLNPKLQGDLASWFGSVPSNLEACKGNALLTDEAARPTDSATSTRSTSGAHRSPSAKRNRNACPITAGSRITLRCSAAADPSQHRRLPPRGSRVPHDSGRLIPERIAPLRRRARS
jgi:putative spermidine/putrescine transport system substrate-binding protein